MSKNDDTDMRAQRLFLIYSQVCSMAKLSGSPKKLKEKQKQKQKKQTQNRKLTRGGGHSNSIGFSQSNTSPQAADARHRAHVQSIMREARAEADRILQIAREQADNIIRAAKQEAAQALARHQERNY